MNLLTRGNESLESKNCKQESKLYGAGGNEGGQSRSSGKEGWDAVYDKCQDHGDRQKKEMMVLIAKTATKTINMI